MQFTDKPDSPLDFELTHHIVPGEPGRDHVEEMAEAFISQTAPFVVRKWPTDTLFYLFQETLEQWNRVLINVGKSLAVGSVAHEGMFSTPLDITETQALELANEVSTLDRRKRHGPRGD